MAALTFDTVNVSGRPDGDPLGPELGDGIDWEGDTTEKWRINAAGQVGFVRDLDPNVPAAVDRGVWRWTAGSKNLLIREGSPAPGQPTGVTSSSLSDQDIDLADDGTLLTITSLAGTGVAGSTNTVFLSFAPNNSGSTVIREGGAAPGLAPLIITDNLQNRAFHRRLAPDGTFAFHTVLSGPGVNASTDSVLFLGTLDGFSPLAREGNPVPGMPAGSVYGSSDFTSLSPAGGNAAFIMPVVNPDLSVQQAVFLAHGNVVTPIVTANGTPSGGPAPFSAFQNPRTNSAGDVSFRAEFGSSQGFYKVPASGGNLELLAHTGNIAPGTSDVYDEITGSTSWLDHELTESGSIAFHFQLKDASGDPSPSVDATNNDGFWINDASGTRLAIREGDVAGSLADVTIGQPERYAFNSQQNLVLLAGLTGNVTADNDQALWWVKPNGQMELIVRAGDLFDVDPSSGVDSRTISTIKLDNVGSSASLVRIPHAEGILNDANQLVFALDFTDGHSGLFVTTLVPEPTSALMGGGGVILALAIGRRRR